MPLERLKATAGATSPLAFVTTSLLLVRFFANA
jgi:hypothetical protein